MRQRHLPLQGLSYLFIFTPGVKEGVSFAGGGLYPWLLAALYLHSEVWHMILSKRANRREVERAAAEAAARATAETTARVAAEATAAAQARLREWYEQHKEQWPEGLPLPPGVERHPADNGNGSQ